MDASGSAGFGFALNADGIASFIFVGFTDTAAVSIGAFSTKDMVLSRFGESGIDNFFWIGLEVTADVSLVGPFSTEDMLPSLFEELPSSFAANTGGIDSFFLVGLPTVTAGDSLIIPFSTDDALPSLFEASTAESVAVGFGANAAGIARFFFFSLARKAGVSLIGPCSLEVELHSLSESELDANAAGIANFCLGRIGDFEGLTGASLMTTPSSALRLEWFLSGCRGLDEPEANAAGIVNFFFLVPANALWTSPFSDALESISTTSAD